MEYRQKKFANDTSWEEGRKKKLEAMYYLWYELDLKQLLYALEKTPQ